MSVPILRSSGVYLRFIILQIFQGVQYLRVEQRNQLRLFGIIRDNHQMCDNPWSSTICSGIHLRSSENIGRAAKSAANLAEEMCVGVCFQEIQSVQINK